MSSYDVNIVAACHNTVWDSNTEKFPASVKSLIKSLGVDYKFRIFLDGARHTNLVDDGTVEVNHHFTTGLKATFTLDDLSSVQSFENSLGVECKKIDADYKLRVRTRNHLA